MIRTNLMIIFKLMNQFNDFRFVFILLFLKFDEIISVSSLIYHLKYLYDI